MSEYYPVVLKLAGKRCLVVGNGFGAAEKAAALEACGATVARLDEYGPGALEGFFLVVAATGSSAGNRQVWIEAETRGTLMNAIDDPAHCNFILPAIHREGDVIVAVSSSGKSPALASRLRDRFAAALGPQYGALADLLGEMRTLVASRLPDFEQRRGAYRRMIDSEALGLLEQNEPEAARTALLAALEDSEVADGVR